VILQPNNGRLSVAGLFEAGHGSPEPRLSRAAVGLREASYSGAASPSLTASSGLDAPAYEWKFLLSETQAADVEARARRDMVSDPHVDRISGDYRITSVYCDTAGFDVFHRRGLYRRRKHRLRRYGRAPWVYFERKTKWGDRVKKLRTPIREGEVPLLGLPASARTWSGHWFHRHLTRRRLAPVCRLAYDRVALVGESSGGACRLTFDRRIHGTLTDGWELCECDGCLPVLAGQVVCEFKFHTCPPVVFKEIIRELGLIPSRVSKFRAFLRASGRVGDGLAVDA
jgi:hypothetical protein